MPPGVPGVPLAASAALAAAITLAAWAARALTTTGAVAAWSVGTLILTGTGWPGGAVLAVFFVASTAVSRAAVAWVAQREQTAEGTRASGGMPTPGAVLTSDAKGEQRDLWQVYANGGPAALAAAAAWAGWLAPPLALWAITASLGAAAADTWATAVGALSRHSPRRLFFGPAVPPGANGGMTTAGIAGAAAGALAVAVTGAALGGGPRLLAAGTLIGFGGMLLDSLLGATLQGRFTCPACRVPSEWRVHRCGTPTVPVGGVRWLTNDGVNGTTTATAALLGAAAWWMCS